MLSRTYSLKGDENFKRVKTKGKLYQSKNFGVRVLKRNDDELSKFGFVVSTRLSKLAVNRNRVARVIKQSVRGNLFRVPKNYDMVFLAKKGIMDKLTVEIMREVDDFFKKNFASKKK